MQRTILIPSIMKTLFLKYYLVLFPSILFSQTHLIDSIKTALKKATHDSVRCNLLNKIIQVDERMEARIGYYDQMTMLGERNLNEKDIPLRNYYIQSMATSINNKAYYLTVKGNIVEALELYKKSIKYMYMIGDKQNTAYLMNNIGAIYDSQGDLVKALVWFQKSLKELNALNDTNGIASTFCNIGNIHKKQNDHSTALNYYKKSLALFEKSKNKQGVATSYNYIGSIYHEMRMDSLAIKYLEKSLKLRQELELKPGIAQSFNNIGSVYKNQRNFNQALVYFKKSIEIYKEIQELRGIVNTSDNIAQVLFEQGKSTEALAFAQESLKGAMKLGVPLVTRNIAGTLKLIYQRQQNYQEALKMFELQMKMKDSLNNMETRKATYKHELQFQYEKKEAELIAQQDKENAIAKEKIKQKEAERNYFIIGFAMLIVFIIFILKGYRQKKKDNKTIIEQKAIVELKQKEIVDSIRYAQKIQKAHLPNESYIFRSISRLKKY